MIHRAAASPTPTAADATAAAGSTVAGPARRSTPGRQRPLLSTLLTPPQALLVLLGVVTVVLVLEGSAVPDVVRVPVVLAGVVGLPGAAAVGLLGPVDVVTRLVLVPVVGVALLTLGSLVTLRIGYWDPQVLAVVLVAAGALALPLGPRLVRAR